MKQQWPDASEADHRGGDNKGIEVFEDDKHDPHRQDLKSKDAKQAPGGGAPAAQHPDEDTRADAHPKTRGHREGKSSSSAQKRATAR
jgi:hypothetical protein